MRLLPVLLAALALSGCRTSPDPSAASDKPYLLVLGVAQDAGHPQAGCRRDCCAPVWAGRRAGHRVSFLALADPRSGKAWLFDATPDFPRQQRIVEADEGLELGGIFLTHAHIGHYTGLMHLGREAVGAREMAVYAMPGMTDFLENNGPWSQLVALRNIAIRPLRADSAVALAFDMRVTPFRVPHRDEYAETVGYRIDGPLRSAVFIPDIDKWNRWDRNLAALIREVDYAFLDGTFYRNGEIPGRDMAEIPHPFVEETMALLSSLPAAERAKVFFIHLNHTNPLLDPAAPAAAEVAKQGFGVAREGMRVGL
jgi:pyrroloquinoline quinone biosynthesis protein B